MPYALMLIDAVDITTPEGWERATSMRPGDAETLGEPLPATQRDATTFTFDNLQEGLYLLRPERGADLLVTVPVANGQWECDVTITAKPAGTPSISHPAPVTAEPLPSRRLASTGANVLLIAALGALALLGGWALSRKGRG